MIEYRISLRVSFCGCYFIMIMIITDPHIDWHPSLHSTLIAVDSNRRWLESGTTGAATAATAAATNAANEHFNGPIPGGGRRSAVSRESSLLDGCRDDGDSLRTEHGPVADCVPSCYATDRCEYSSRFGWTISGIISPSSADLNSSAPDPDPAAIVHLLVVIADH